MVDPERFELSTSTLQGLHSPGLSYGPIKAGLLSIKHPIGSEFHIISRNERKRRHRFVLVHYWMFFLHPFLIKYNRIHFSISALDRFDSGNFTY